MRTPTSDELRLLYESHSSLEYQQQLQQIVAELLSVLRTIPVKSHVKCRVKSFAEYYRKWTSLGGTEQTPIGDMLGVRIICPFLDDVRVVEKALAGKLRIAEVDHKGANHSFREFGYESTHLVLELDRDTISHQLPGVAPVCEIQLRTILQDAWAEVEHELIYKFESSIPTDQIRRKLAALNANLSLSDVIFQELRDSQKEVQRMQEKLHEIQNTSSRLIPSDELSRRLHEELADAEDDEREDLERLTLRALTAHSEELFVRAIRLYSRILTLPQADSIRAIILNHRGMAYFAVGENNAARADFEAALALDGKNYRAWYNVGLTHQAIGDSGRALNAFAKCCKLEPTFFDGQIHHIRALLEQREIESAGQALRALRESDSQRPEAMELWEAFKAFSRLDPEPR